MFVHPLYVHMPPGGANTPHMSPCSYASMFWEASACCAGCRGPLHVGHLPYMPDTSPHMGDASPYVLHPHSLVGFPMHLYV